jgi:hypothetical protein
MTVLVKWLGLDLIGMVAGGWCLGANRTCSSVSARHDVV